jgi:hypothetical protein
MQPMSTVLQNAFGNAYPQWDAAIRHAGWHAMALAFGYALAGMLCCAAAFATRRDDSRGWLLAAGLLTLIGVNSVVRFDLLAIFALRAVAHAQGWYEQRRVWQLIGLAAVAVAGVLALGELRVRLRDVWARCAGAVVGVGLLTGIATLRAISHHVTDIAFGVHLLGISTGRLLEFAGLGLTATSALRWSRGR